MSLLRGKVEAHREAAEVDQAWNERTDAILSDIKEDLKKEAKKEMEHEHQQDPPSPLLKHQHQAPTLTLTVTLPCILGGACLERSSNSCPSGSCPHPRIGTELAPYGASEGHGGYGPREGGSRGPGTAQKRGPNLNSKPNDKQTQHCLLSSRRVGLVDM